MRDSFVFYKSFYDAIKQIPEEYQLELYNAILGYSLEGLEPSNLSDIASAMFTLIKPNIDSAQKKYEASVSNGKRGGRPKEETKKKPNNNPEETQKKPNNNLEETQEKPNPNLNDNDNEDDNEDDNEGDNDNDNDNIKKGKNKKRKTFEEVLAENSCSEELKSSIRDFIDMRKTIKKPMTSKALELLLRNLEKLTNLEEEKIAILNQSIEHGWQTVYPLKTNNMQNSSKGEIKEEEKQEELKEVDISGLTPEEYDLLVKKKITIQDLIRKGRIHV